MCSEPLLSYLSSARAADSFELSGMPRFLATSEPPRTYKWVSFVPFKLLELLNELRDAVLV
jgi:hypothetical protein